MQSLNFEALQRITRNWLTWESLLEASMFKSAVPPNILDKFHVVRRTGNKGAHPGPVTQATALSLLKEAHDLGKWWAIRALGADLVSLPAFRTPPVRPSGPPEVQKTLEEQKQLLENAIAELPDSISRGSPGAGDCSSQFGSLYRQNILRRHALTSACTAAYCPVI